MTRAVWKCNLAATTLALLATLVLFECTELDLVVQDALYRGNHQWLVNPHDPWGHLFFYTGIKALLIIAGAGMAVAFMASFRLKGLRPYRRRLLLMVAAMSLVPLAISGLKNATNVYFPSQIERYGGTKPYVKVFSRYPPGYHQKGRGRGYPAGHASGGFSLMMLYFVFRSRAARGWGLGAGLAAGWWMGGYQMAKGAHFLSHTVVTMLAAWWMILIIYRVAGWGEPAGEPQPDGAPLGDPT